jgi:hypothetical protein
MEIRVRRIALKDTYTIGKMYIDGTYFCDVLEDKVRDLNKNGVFDNGEVKIANHTAIPYGTYEITMDVRSTKFSDFEKYPWAKEYDGYLPRLTNVPLFVGVLLHVGNSDVDSSGCLLVGENKVVGKVVNSTITFRRLMNEYLIPAKNRGEKIYITIV